MRFFKKYKIWNKIFDSNIPLRIFNFKRSKWKKLKKKKIFKRKFLDFQILPNKRYKYQKLLWKKKKLFYKNFLRYKHTYKNRYDWSISEKKIHKIFSNRTSAIKANIFNIDYRIDIILWKLRLCKTTFAARQLIQNSYLLLNGTILINTKKILKEGDIIEFKNLVKILPKTFLKKEIKFSFIEIDYYSQTFIIIKDSKKIGPKDFSCSIQDHYSEYQINNLLYI